MSKVFCTRKMLYGTIKHLHPEANLSTMISISEAFAGVADSRKSQGGSYKLPHVLCAVLLAKLCGCGSLRQIEAWMAEHRGFLNEQLGFGWRRTPKKSGLSFILASVDPQELALRASAQGAQSAPILADGKALRGEGALALSVFESATKECLARLPFTEGREPQTLIDWIESGAAGSRMVSADAAHAQKKPSSPRKKPAAG